MAILGTGVWRWRRSESAPKEEEGETNQPEESALDELIAEIARLDEAYEQQGLDIEEYKNRRRALMQRAKLLL